MSIWGSAVRPRTMDRAQGGGVQMEAAPTTTAVPDPKRWLALALVCTAFFMTVLDVSIVNVALPSIGRSLHFSETGLQWVVTAYAITYGGFLLLGGARRDSRATGPASGHPRPPPASHSSSTRSRKRRSTVGAT